MGVERQPHVAGPKVADIGWLLDSDPSIRWQVMRDPTDETDEAVELDHASHQGSGRGKRGFIATETGPGHPRPRVVRRKRQAPLLHRADWAVHLGHALGQDVGHSGGGEVVHAVEVGVVVHVNVPQR